MGDTLLDGALWHATVPIFPILTKAAHGLAQADCQRSDGFEALLAAIGELAVVFAPHFGKQQFGIAENSSEWIVEFVTQRLTEGFLVVFITQERRRCDRFLDRLA